MELRTPAPLSDDEIYHFAETVPTGPLPEPPSSGKQVDGDVLATPTPAGVTPQTMMSDPVVVTLNGPEAVVSDPTVVPGSEQSASVTAGSNGKSTPAKGGGTAGYSSRVNATREQSGHRCEYRTSGQ